MVEIYFSNFLFYYFIFRPENGSFLRFKSTTAALPDITATMLHNTIGVVSPVFVFAAAVFSAAGAVVVGVAVGVTLGVVTVPEPFPLPGFCPLSPLPDGGSLT